MKNNFSWQVFCVVNTRTAHFLRNNYPHECRFVHGEFYRFEITISATSLNKYGMIVDFKDIKKLLKDKYDHTLINDKTPFDKINPTAENIAKVSFFEIQDFLNKQENKPTIIKIKVFESDESNATFSLGGLNEG